MIEILYGYQDREHHYIPRGTYALNDPVLKGKADYLIANGHAVLVSLPDDELDAVTEVLPETKRRRTKKAE